MENETMIRSGILGLAAMLLAGCLHQTARAQPPDKLPDAAPIPAACGDELICEQPAGYASSPSCRRGSRLSRWWHGSAKPCLQYSHWGYPEYFEEMPFGAGVTAVQSAQICNGWTSRLMLYHYDFCDGAASLNLHGQRRLNELAAAHHIWMHHVLRVEATPGAPRLDQARRNHVTRMLADAGLPVRVEIASPIEVSPFGDETRIVNDNLLRQVRSGKPLGGSAGGTSSYGATALGGGNQNQGAQ
jgi:hypothetical protein